MPAELVRAGELATTRSPAAHVWFLARVVPDVGAQVVCVAVRPVAPWEMAHVPQLFTLADQTVWTGAGNPLLGRILTMLVFGCHRQRVGGGWQFLERRRCKSGTSQKIRRKTSSQHQMVILHVIKKIRPLMRQQNGTANSGIE